MNAKIALNMSMVKFYMWEHGPDATFRKVREAGVSCFELSQVDMTEEYIDRLLEASAKHGVTVMATSVNYLPLFPNAKGLDLERDLEKVIAFNKKLGVRYIRDSLMPSCCVNRREGFLEAAQALNHYGELLAREGLKLYYHNHHFEFQRFGDKTGFELLAEATDPRYVGFELDVHWLQRGGQDPIRWIRRLAGRTDLVHLKDYRIRMPDVAPTPALLHQEQSIQFAEIGAGTLDMPAIIDASLQSGAVYLPIEQDDTYGRDPFDCLKESVENIRAMGYGALL